MYELNGLIMSKRQRLLVYNAILNIIGLKEVANISKIALVAIIDDSFSKDSYDLMLKV